MSKKYHKTKRYYRKKDKSYMLKKYNKCLSSKNIYKYINHIMNKKFKKKFKYEIINDIYLMDDIKDFVYIKIYIPKIDYTKRLQKIINKYNDILTNNNYYFWIELV